VQQGAERLILQRVNPIFGPEVHKDIEAVTAQLQDHGVETPLLVRSRRGGLFEKDSEGKVWRVLTFVEGETVQQVDSPGRARQAGALLGRFHRVFHDSGYQFKHQRPGVHDTVAHLESLSAALSACQEHPAHVDVAPVGAEIQALAAELPDLSGRVERIVHGDPKISNIIFAPDGRARCLVDLDTLARMPLHLELGDAMRSWCNPAGEEQPGELDLHLLGAALEGYASTAHRPNEAERAALPYAPWLIALELSARFCADALRERYFGWDPQRFPSASAHNLCRARSQLALARSARVALAQIQQLTGALWS
jgi:Ser/Thr protein kinase RdoA (MazF antagonist)